MNEEEDGSVHSSVKIRKTSGPVLPDEFVVDILSRFPAFFHSAKDKENKN